MNMMRMTIGNIYIVIRNCFFIFPGPTYPKGQLMLVALMTVAMLNQSMVELENIPGTDQDLMTVDYGDGSPKCVLTVNRSDVLNDYPKIEKLMLKLCFGEDAEVGSKKP